MGEGCLKAGKGTTRGLESYGPMDLSRKMGFEVVLAKKGIFVDGHERDDVVAYRNIFS